MGWRTTGAPGTREDPAIAARRAGDRGWHADPIDTTRRATNYVLQNGGWIYTPKQRRRAQKKHQRAKKLGLIAAAAAP